MQKEKIVAIILVVIIVGALLSFILINYGDEIYDNLFGGDKKNTIELGDCAQVNYIGRYASNNTVFDSSYLYVENKTGGTPLNIFVSLDPDLVPPDEYSDYSSGMIKGFMNGLIGLKKGQTVTIGPIPPEEAYGVYPKAGDTIDVTGESFTQEMHLEFINITKDAPVPDEYKDFITGNTTTLFILKDRSYQIGQKLTLYQPWPNATTVTQLNDTVMWLETNPPDDKINNFTWIELDAYGSEIYYWENSSNVTMNETTIVVTHSPEIGQIMEASTGYSTIEYSVVNLTEDKINVSYEASDGNLSYVEIDRKITIDRNQTQNITYSWPYEMMDYVLSILKQMDDTISYSLDALAGETLLFEVEIVEVYKTSQTSSS